MINLRLFESCLGMLPKQKKRIYLQENQGWESGFINAWRNEKHGTLIDFLMQQFVIGILDTFLIKEYTL